MTNGMDPTYLVDQPNKVAEIYRNYRPTIMPLEIEKHLDFIDISEDGYFLLGSSNLTGRYWRGSVWYYSKPPLPPQKEECETGMECDNTVSDGQFLNNKTIIVGDDGGAVIVYEITKREDGTLVFTQKSARYEHDSSVSSISVSTDKTGIVSAGFDMCIKVWDGDELSPAQTFRNAHSHQVTKVAHSPEPGSRVFASTGLDGLALVWDTRQPKPASVVIDHPGEGMTAVTWKSGDFNTLAVGSSFGNVSLMDLRTNSSIQQSAPYKRTIFKLLFINPRSMVVCADSNELKVIDTSSPNLDISYMDKRHSDFVRGLAYDNKASVLYSCGWDKQVLSHSLP
ncbi:methylosome protein 50-like [Macrosteles quadrilineatus]|uniref:methylosome protein 50-like n=1 Tax=Macrosteles quadrilineatus TaxID=74068 RepID=UPI0023E2F1B9|nr:methylosome protein 50-like [Macrosteles quadrilineatus]